jgi:hypothetical protein
MAELEAENKRLKKGEVFLQMIRDGNSFAYSAAARSERRMTIEKQKYKRKKHSSVFYAIESGGTITQGTWVERKDAVKEIEKEFQTSWKTILKEFKHFKIIKVLVTKIPKPKKHPSTKGGEHR